MYSVFFLMQKHTFSAYIYPDHHQMMTSVSVRRRPDVLFSTSLIQTLIYLFPSSLVNAKFAGEIIILEPNTLTPEKGQTSLPVLIKVASPFLEMSRCTCLLKERRHCFIRLFLATKLSIVKIFSCFPPHSLNKNGYAAAILSR